MKIDYRISLILVEFKKKRFSRTSGHILHAQIVNGRFHWEPMYYFKTVFVLLNRFTDVSKIVEVSPAVVYNQPQLLEY